MRVGIKLILLIGRLCVTQEMKMSGDQKDEFD
jgi:hypothetical protein